MTRHGFFSRCAGLTVAAVVSLAGCSGNSANSASKASDAAGPAATNGGTAPKGAKVDLAQARLTSTRREIVYSANVDVRVRDVESALRSATERVERVGGSLFKQRSDLDHTATVSVTYKVPPRRFNDALDAIGKLGRVTSRQVNASDVTSRVVDVQARVAAAHTSVDRLRGLLAQSGNVGDLLTVERELAAREADMESLEGQLAALRARVDEATITAQFTSPGRSARGNPEPAHLPGFPTGLRTGARAFRNAAIVVGGALGFALPFALVVAIVGAPMLVLRRRQRHAGA